MISIFKATSSTLILHADDLINYLCIVVKPNYLFEKGATMAQSRRQMAGMGSTYSSEESQNRAVINLKTKVKMNLFFVLLPTQSIDNKEGGK